jgi:hypothetical protein
MISFLMLVCVETTLSMLTICREDRSGGAMTSGTARGESKQGPASNRAEGPGAWNCGWLVETGIGKAAGGGGEGEVTCASTPVLKTRERNGAKISITRDFFALEPPNSGEAAACT